jgi:hypothetical protein
MRALRIGFLTTTGVNVGDEFIREGIRHCLDRVGRPYTALLVNKHDASSLSEPRDTEPERFADKYAASDVFIQSGAPVFWHNGLGKSTTADWHQWAWEDRILARNAPSSPAFLNLGAGSCFAWMERGESFLADAVCADFARRSGRRAAVLTVRDEAASHILTVLDVPHHRLPCPAFLAGGRWPRQRTGGYIGVNLMPLGGHYDFKGDFDRYAWIEQAYAVTRRLRRMGKIVFLCHSQDELEMARLLAHAGEVTFHSSAYRDYLDLLPQLDLVFANRVHCAVTAAGFGIPAVIAGNDTRALIGDWIGIPVYSSAAIDPECVSDCIAELLQRSRNERERLLALREETAQRYTDLLAPVLESLPNTAIADTPEVMVEHPLKRWLAAHPSDRNWREQLGIESFWFVRESGLYAKEPYGGEYLRWTGAEAKLTLPSLLTPDVTEVRVELWPVHPPGHTGELRVNGQSVPMPAGEQVLTCPVHRSPGQNLTLEIRSPVLNPVGDSRKLGMALRKIVLRGSTNS